MEGAGPPPEAGVEDEEELTLEGIELVEDEAIVKEVFKRVATRLTRHSKPPRSRKRIKS